MMDSDAPPARSLDVVGDTKPLKTDPMVHGLSDAKLRAVEALVSGIRPGVVAKQLNVSRETLWRWRQEPAFRQHVQRLRVELHTARLDRMWSLVDRAFDVVEEHINEGDLQAAATLLKLTRIDPTHPLADGPDGPDGAGEREA